MLLDVHLAASRRLKRQTDKHITRQYYSRSVEVSKTVGSSFCRSHDLPASDRRVSVGDIVIDIADEIRFLSMTRACTAPFTCPHDDRSMVLVADEACFWPGH